MNPNSEEIEDALSEVERIVHSAGKSNDQQYFDFHKGRYLRMAITIASALPKGASILNIGSHYLHTSLLFKILGYDVHSMDVDVFWNLDFIKERARAYSLPKIVEDNLETFSSHENINDRYDAILFAEILEHITFNPVSFWRKIYRIIKNSGLIYISTPNSLNLYNIFRTLARILTFRGVGIPIGSIFSNVTYGHHWKEYSVFEIENYFQSLSDDFVVSTAYYHYRKTEFNSFYSSLMSIFSIVGNALYFFSDEIEAVVKIKKTGSWKIELPKY